MMHFGHANALRQARAMGDYLVVGVHSDADITKHKGKPVMLESERYAAVRACKWVDEVVEGAPYITDLALMDKYDCDFCVHGDDLVIGADGRDTYAAVKEAGRFKECKRTEGVSTTELVGRMLLMTKEHHQREMPVDSESEEPSAKKVKRSPYTGIHRMLPTNKRIVQFSYPQREAKTGDRVVYVDGGFDLFHAGHAALLEAAKAMGDYLLVGIHDDQVINRVRGDNYPLNNLQERVLSVLSCRWVDEVIIGAPYSITEEVLSKIYPIHLVIHGQTEVPLDANHQDPYALAKERGIYRQIETPFSYLTAQVIIDRIIQNRLMYEERNRKKEAKEVAAIEAQEERERQKQNQ